MAIAIPELNNPTVGVIITHAQSPSFLSICTGGNSSPSTKYTLTIAPSAAAKSVQASRCNAKDRASHHLLHFADTHLFKTSTRCPRHRNTKPIGSSTNKCVCMQDWPIHALSVVTSISWLLKAALPALAIADGADCTTFAP